MQYPGEDGEADARMTATSMASQEKESLSVNAHCKWLSVFSVKMISTAHTKHIKLPSG
jgi:hypothetical protein